MWPPMAIIELVRVLSPVGRPKVVATTGKIPMLVLVLTQRSNLVSPGRRQLRFFHFLQRHKYSYTVIQLHVFCFLSNVIQILNHEFAENGFPFCCYLKIVSHI